MFRSAAISAVVGLAIAQETTGGFEAQSGHIFDMVHMKIDGEDYVQFDVRIPNNTWFALNVGGLGMGRGDDMITFKANGDDSTFLDGYSRGWRTPGVDDKMNLTGETTYSADKNEVYFKVKRKLDTGDADNDFLIQLDKEFDMSWALQANTNDTGRKHSKRSRLPDVMLSSNGQYTWGLTQVETEKEDPVEETDDPKEDDEEETPTTEETPKDILDEMSGALNLVQGSAILLSLSSLLAGVF